MICEVCGSGTHVIDSRAGFKTIRRRRECDSCKHRFTTYEYSADDEALPNDKFRRVVRNVIKDLLEGLRDERKRDSAQQLPIPAPRRRKARSIAS